MWTYIQKTGELLHDGQHVASGYSGFEQGKNNPDMQDKPDVGPIPVGSYTIGPMYHDTTHGPVVMHLWPAATNEMFGRDGFLIHGDSIAHPGSASHGCIILERPVREEIAKSPDRQLQVVKDEEQETDTTAQPDTAAAA